MTEISISQMLFGAIAMAGFTISLFFLKFWRTTKDRFFIFFSLAFLLEGVGRVLLGLSYFPDEKEPLIYLIRLVSFLLILFAIADKNRSAPKATDGS